MSAASGESRAQSYRDFATLGSENFVDQIVSLDWVKQAAAIKRTDGMKAMEHYVADQKAARRSTPD